MKAKKDICPHCSHEKDVRAEMCSPCRMKKFSPRLGTGVPRRINANGYVTIQRNRKAIYEHRAVMEDHLGRKLRRDEHIHHRNHIRTDNRLENLEVIDSREHARRHFVLRQKKMTAKSHFVRWGYVSADL